MWVMYTTGKITNIVQLGRDIDMIAIAENYIAQLITTFVTIPLTQKSCQFVIFKTLENLSYNKFQVICFETIAK